MRGCVSIWNGGKKRKRCERTFETLQKKYFGMVMSMVVVVVVMMTKQPSILF